MTPDTTDDDSCILWTKYTTPDGYGKRKYQGKTHRAHRAAFHEAHGYWPNICRHTCDVRACVNPDHLLDGTYQDNSDDMVARGRWNGGPTPLNPDMPAYRLDNPSAYHRERYRRQKAGTWEYRKTV